MPGPQDLGDSLTSFRTIGVVLVALMPGNFLRIWLYRLFFGYHIDWNARLGWMALLDVRECRISGGRIGTFNQVSARSLTMAPGSVVGRLNRFKDVNEISLGEGCAIVARNRFIGPRRGLTPFERYSNISVGRHSVVVTGHYFDLSDSITLGDDVTVGGRGIEFWTHGFDLSHIKIQGPITVGDQVYFGSGSKVLPGVTVTDRVLIGAGTVVAKSITESGTYVSSQLIRKGETPDFSGDSGMVEHGGARFLRRDP